MSERGRYMEFLTNTFNTGHTFDISQQSDIWSWTDKPWNLFLADDIFWVFLDAFGERGGDWSTGLGIRWLSDTLFSETVAERRGLKDSTRFTHTTVNFFVIGGLANLFLDCLSRSRLVDTRRTNLRSPTEAELHIAITAIICGRGFSKFFREYTLHAFRWVCFAYRSTKRLNPFLYLQMAYPCNVVCCTTSPLKSWRLQLKCLS